MPRKNFKNSKRDNGNGDYDHKVLDVARVTRVVKGGKRFSFKVIAVVGDRKGSVGVGVGKGADTTLGVEKAIRDAQKNLVKISLTGTTILHEIRLKYGSARVLLKPAKRGKGIVAGGAIRTVCDLVGIKDISAKMLGSSNKLNNARATITALSKLKTISASSPKETVSIKGGSEQNIEKEENKENK